MVFYQIVEREDFIIKAEKTLYIIFTITHYIVTFMLK